MNLPISLQIFFVLSTSIINGVTSIDFNDDHGLEPLDKAGWIDPSDPNSRNFRNADDRLLKLLDENQKLKKRLADLERTNRELLSSSTNGQCAKNSIDGGDGGISRNEIALFKHFLRKLTAKMPEAGIYLADIRLSEKVAKSWRDFIDSSTTIETSPRILQNTADSIADLFVRVTRDAQIADSEPSWIDRLRDRVRSYLLVLNIFVLIPAAALIFSRFRRISRWQLAMWIFFVLFFLSVVWTWIHLYKERQAEMQARFVKNGGPSACVPRGEITPWKAIADKFISIFHVGTDDPCVEYYKDLTIDPIWTVTPLEAVSMAIAKFFITPLKPAAHGIAQFWNALLSGLPIQYYFIVLPAMGLFVVFMFLILWGYKLRLGFGLLSLEPHGHQPPQRRQQSIEALENDRRSPAREISTQTAPAVTWSKRNVDRAIGGEDQGSHVRRPSATN